MRSNASTTIPLGRLYDPLTHLARRVHRLLGARCKTVWTDERGRVFVNDAGLVVTTNPRSIIGSYDCETQRAVIERDLRLALRERASHWILDWNLPPARSPKGRSHVPLSIRNRKQPRTQSEAPAQNAEESQACA
jgi:hypothetical protein